MSIKRVGLLGLRLLHICRWCLAFTSLPFILASLSRADAAGQSDPVVARNLGAFFEVFLGRKLSGGELWKVTDEYIKWRAGKGKTREYIYGNAQLFGSNGKMIREDKGDPTEFTLRHKYIEWVYFEPEMKNTTFLRLLTEPDPARVINHRSRRLMTERDVVAMANIRDFAKSEGDPRHKNLFPVVAARL